ncbi:MAG: CobW family GTP-binding protein [Propylenella sp.]
MNDIWSAPITANILTGFLGSGKTSLLRRLLRQPDLSDTAVMINEFGEVGLDHLLIESVTDDMVLLDSGCVCCTIRGDLKDALLRLYARRQRGEVSPFRRVVIETTGLADPAPIVATFAADPMLKHHFRVGNVVTVIDAECGAANLDGYEECRRQVAVADRLVVSKIDIAGTRKARELRRRVSRINSTAEIVESGESDDASAALLTHDTDDAATRLEEVRRWIATSIADDHEHGDHIGHTHESRHGDIRALLLSADEPLDWAAFGLWLSMLLNRHGASVLRVKGLINVVGRDSPVVVQGVQHMIHKPVHLDRWPEDVPRTRLVLIVRGLDERLIERSFRAFMRLGASAASGQDIFSSE